MKNLTRVEQILKAVANKKRLEIMRILMTKKELSVEDIANAIHLSYRSTSKHLTQLLRAGIIERTQKSRYAYFSLSKQEHPIVTLLLKSIQ